MNTNGKLVGFALVNANHKNQKGNMRIRLIGTNKGKGIGRMLIEQIINNARGRGLKTVTLESVPEARGFYNKIGFLPIGIGNNMRYYLSPLISKRRSPSRPSRARRASS
jgi:GNAT superfamily N-acetyltransferase